MSVTLQTPLSQIMANKRRVSALKSLGVVTVEDALTYYPFRVTDPVPMRALSQASIGVRMACVVDVMQVRVAPMARHGSRVEVLVEDAGLCGAPVGSARASLVFFSYKRQYVQWLCSRLDVGMRLVIAGEPSVFQDRLQFTHPDMLTVLPSMDGSASGREDVGELADAIDGTGVQALPRGERRYDVRDASEGLQRVCRPRPVYHASSRISTDHIHDTVVQCLQALGDGALPDIIPESMRSERGLLHRAEALHAIHEPPSVKDFHDGVRTMRYEEALVCQTALVQSRLRSNGRRAIPCEQTAARDAMLADLPFALTDGQRSVVDAIAADMSSERPMRRLLQGEVGSGKTVVALAAMMQAVGSGYQAVLVAPTQVLAEQHVASISKMVGDGVPVVLLMGGMPLAARRRALATIASGEPCVVVATHAAFSRSFQAPNLALAVIDEQHRFGVEQRAALDAYGEVALHVLVMTATPIPRTAAMTWFGDLDMSWLTELPGGRKPIRTVVVREDDARLMSAMFRHVRQRIDAGERVFVVCPRIDDDERDEVLAEDELSAVVAFGNESEGGERGGEEAAEPRVLHSVTQILQRLSGLDALRGVAMQTLTGRDDDERKREVMERFVSGECPLLVATTVIEVGVDVPLATCMVVFDADRYGLSQLHQLRGRVGRGGLPSWAFLVSCAPQDSVAQQRLQVVESSLDGAVIAEADLSLRGAGDVLGDAQSGLRSSLKLLRVVQDAAIIEDARCYAQALLADDPDLTGEVPLAGAVLDMMRGNESMLLHH